MIIQDIDFRHYTIPFKIPFTTSRGLEQHRHGLMIRLIDDQGITGYGEAVSLPGFGTGTLDQFEDWLKDLIPRLSGSTITDAFALVHASSPDPLIAPIRFAMDTALLDIQGKEAGLSISKMIKPDAASHVPLNATISDMDASGAANAAYYAATAGYTAIKMKVGTFQDLGRDIERVAAVRDAIGPDTALRLDANGAWTFSRALEIAQRITPYDIDYIEQPLPAGDISGMAELRRQTEIALAADESATSHRAVEQIIEASAADVIVIKPAVIGGIKIARELVHLADSASIRTVVTSALESGVAITSALHLAATLSQPIPACGLATSVLLETDLLVESPRIEHGRMEVPTQPGLGVEPVSSIWKSAR